VYGVSFYKAFCAVISRKSSATIFLSDQTTY